MTLRLLILLPLRHREIHCLFGQLVGLCVLLLVGNEDNIKEKSDEKSWLK